MSDLLLKKLRSYLHLGEEQGRAVLSLPAQTRTVGARWEIADTIDYTDGAAGVYMIEKGFACRYKYLADGRRQILCFLLPGDVVNLRRFIVGPSQLPVGSLSPLTLRVFPSDGLLSTLERHPQIAKALWRSILTEDCISQEWLVSVGQRSAIERMAHLLCELYTRLATVGLADPYTFELPVTQNDLADALGLSTVHVNRTLQELRKQGYIVLHKGTVTILDIEDLKSLALFSASYLHYHEPEPAQSPAASL